MLLGMSQANLWKSYHFLNSFLIDYTLIKEVPQNIAIKKIIISIIRITVGMILSIIFISHYLESLILKIELKFYVQPETIYHKLL